MLVTWLLALSLASSAKVASTSRDAQLFTQYLGGTASFPAAGANTLKKSFREEPLQIFFAALTFLLSQVRLSALA
jgi:hypothetical protein